MGPLHRVSCACLCRIELDGGLLMEVNRNRGNVLTPLGGGLHAEAVALPWLRELGAVFENAPDLRFEMPEMNLGSFAEWFQSRRDRELSPDRELREELLLEHQACDEWQSPRCIRFLGCRPPFVETTSRVGISGKPTLYFHEIHAVELAGDVARAVRSALGRPSARLRLVPIDPTLEHAHGMPVAASFQGLFLTT